MFEFIKGKKWHFMSKLCQVSLGPQIKVEIRFLLGGFSVNSSLIINLLHCALLCTILPVWDKWQKGPDNDSNVLTSWLLHSFESWFDIDTLGEAKSVVAAERERNILSMLHQVSPYAQILLSLNVVYTGFQIEFIVEPDFFSLFLGGVLDSDSIFAEETEDWCDTGDSSKERDHCLCPFDCQTRNFLHCCGEQDHRKSAWSA